jgi:HD superfamily phosphohydrolase YqeK
MLAPEPLIEMLLAPHATTAGADFNGYSNHCQRMFRFCVALAGDRASADREIYAVAAAFHDLGIFTARTLDYLLPSRALARDWLAAHGKAALGRVVRT